MSAQQINQEVASQAMQHHREMYQRKLAFCDRAEVVLARFPADVIPHAWISDNAVDDELVVMIYNLTREQVTEAIRAAGAGKWQRTVNPSYPERLDYATSIEGVPIRIYGVQPPPSCRIEEKEIHVPAHTKIERTLICS